MRGKHAGKAGTACEKSDEHNAPKELDLNVVVQSVISDWGGRGRVHKFKVIPSYMGNSILNNSFYKIAQFILHVLSKILHVFL